MEWKCYFPSGHLKPHIKHYLILSSEQVLENRLLPDTSLVMVFRLKGAVSALGENSTNQLPATVVTGLRNGPGRVLYAPHSATLLVIFRAAGAAAFFQEPLHHLYGLTIAAAELLPPTAIRQIEDWLAETHDDRQRIALVELFLRQHLCQKTPDALIQKAAQRIQTAGGNIRIKTLAGDLYLNQDTFEKRFRSLMGSSPKQFASIVRLRHLIRSYPQARSLTEAAHAAGYFDQAHFIKDFRVFTGQSPRDFFLSASYW